MRLSYAEGGDNLSAAQGLEPLTLDRVRSEPGKHRHRRAVAEEDGGKAGLGLRKLLAHQRGTP
jgi:hypothetical protein